MKQISTFKLIPSEIGGTGFRASDRVRESVEAHLAMLRQDPEFEPFVNEPFADRRDDAAIAELEWYGRQLIRHRIGAIRQAHPSAGFDEICNQRVVSASPAGLIRARYRDLHRCQQLETESGSSFVKRFEKAVMLYQEYAITDPDQLYETFIAALNKKYLAELRSDISLQGCLTVIHDASARLLEAYATISQIHVEKGQAERSYEAITKARTSPVNAVSTAASTTNTADSWKCKTCKTNDHD
ncbi:hypothetical protein BVRB_017540, partial [Beta vulgaris subsp. vulgaris]